MKKRYIAIIVGGAILGILVGLVFVSKDRRKVKGVSPPFLLEEAETAFSTGRLKEAKKLYKKVLETTEDVDTLNKIQKKIEEINIKLIFSPLEDECSSQYLVKPKDTLFKIAKKFDTTVSLIKRANNLSSDTIRPGQKLKVNTCKFSIVIDKSQNLLFLKRKGEVIKTYIVCTGKDNSTPSGIFKIDQNKLKNPTWFKTGAVIPPDSPENILGSRWMGLEGTDSKGEKIEGYGIHGTTEADALGRQSTLGCIRMKNEDVEELFDILPVGTEVTIVD